MININEKWFKFYTFTRFFVVAAYVLFSCCMLHGFVYDIEPLTDADRYDLELNIYNKMAHYDNESFPTFEQWSQMQQDQKERFWEALNEGIVAATCTHKEYEEYVAERMAARYHEAYLNNRPDADRDAPSSADCPQAPGKEGPK